MPEPLRVLAIEPGVNFSVMDVHNGWVNGLRAAGCDVRSLRFADLLGFFFDSYVKRGRRYRRLVNEAGAVANANQMLRGFVYDFLPHVVVVTSAFFVTDTTLDVLSARGSRVVLIHTESPYEDDRQIARAAHADLNLINDPTNLGSFPSNTVYQHHCYDPAVHFPREVDADARSDFCFVGTGFPSRVEFFERVDWSGVDAAFAGNWKQTSVDSPLRKFLAHDIEHCLENRDTADLYCGTKVSANLYRKEAERPELSDGWACGPREVELAACGTFFLREPRGEGDRLFPMLPTFSSPDEFSEMLRWWLAHPDERLQAAREAREAVADRTFGNAARHLIGELLQLPVTT